MKKVLLLNPPGKRRFIRDQYCSSSTKADYYWPAVDLLVLSGILSENFDLEFLDAIAVNISSDKVLGKIGNGDYYAVISLGSCASFDQDIDFLGKIREISKVKIIVNGGIFRHDPGYYLEKYSCIDAVITDYIKKGIALFLSGVEGPLEGIWYKSGDKITCPSTDAKGDKEFSYPLPRHDLLDLTAYNMPQVKKYPFTCCLISYGCDFNCKYCASASIDFRLRSIDNIVEELLYIKSLGVREVHFPDFTFNASREHCLKLAKAMIKERLDLSWDCLARADLFDEELALCLKKAGLHTVQFGVETHSEQIRRDLSKPITNVQIEKAFSICRRFGLQTIGFFMIGLPNQSEQSISDTVDFACGLDCDWASFSIYVPDAGARLSDELALEYPGISSWKNFDRTTSPLTGNGVLSKEKIWQLRNKAIRSFYLRPAFIIKQMKKIRNLDNLKSISRMALSLFKNN